MIQSELLFEMGLKALSVSDTLTWLKKDLLATTLRPSGKLIIYVEPKGTFCKGTLTR